MKSGNSGAYGMKGALTESARAFRKRAGKLKSKLASIQTDELPGRLIVLCFVDEFFGAATRANESLPGGIAPARQRRRREHGLFLFRFTLSQKTGALLLLAVTLRRVLRSATMLADPAVAGVNKVGGF